MPQLLLEYFPDLKKVAKASKKNRRLMLKNKVNDKNFIKVMQQISKNFKSGNVPITMKQERKLFKCGHVVKGLHGCNKKVVVQSGGFIGAILPILAALLAPIFKKSI
jgi:hypothetical protein